MSSRKLQQNRKYLPPKDGEPALHRAARLGDNEAIRALVTSGADVNLPFDDFRYGNRDSRTQGAWCSLRNLWKTYLNVLTGGISSSSIVTSFSLVSGANLIMREACLSSVCSKSVRIRRPFPKVRSFVSQPRCTTSFKY